MSFYIKGMMPKDGEKLYMLVFSDGKACVSYKPFEWHEVVPVPPHGRLIDADAFIALCREYAITQSDDEFCKHLEYALTKAPTIIPAEEGE